MTLEAQVRKVLAAGVAQVFRRKEFLSWLENEDGPKDGFVGLNNSLIFREELSTVKNGKFICAPIDVHGIPQVDGLCLASNIKFNSDFTYLSPKDKKVAFQGMDEAISAALTSFGRIPLILIGTIIDNVQVETKIDHKLFKEIVLDPTQDDLVSVDDERIVVREAQDEEAIWSALEKASGEKQISEPPLPIDLQKPFAKALDHLRSQSYALVRLPISGKDAKTGGLLDQIAEVLDSQIAAYTKSLARFKDDPKKNVEDFNTILRISYNFSGDAAKVLRLLISLSDLKPVLFWCSVAEWFALAECFRNLPWSKSTNKPSLAAYHSMIAGVRNRSFHNLFPFSKTLKVPLEGVPLGAISLTFFAEYAGRKNPNRFEYQDQALIEAFGEFTRAGEKFVPVSFWTKNLAVMSRTVELLRKTGNSLRLISAHQHG
jgi:hypothetical protein